MVNTSINLNYLKQKVLDKYPAFGSTIANANYQIVDGGHSIQTAATDGHTVFANARFMAGLTEGEQIFIMAHEIMHIALHHIPRGRGKNQELWNYATDAIINQRLKQDGLPMPAGVIEMESAANCDAEELYERLVAVEYGFHTSTHGHDDHSLWEAVMKEIERTDPKMEQTLPISEREIFEKNYQERLQRARTASKIDRITLDNQPARAAFTTNVKKLSKAAIDWKAMAVRALKVAHSHQAATKNVDQEPEKMI